MVQTIMQQQTATNVVEIVVALTAIVTVIVSLITAVTSTKQSAFNQLKIVVDELKEELRQERGRIATLEKEIILANERADEIERELRMFKRHNRRLIRQLRDNKIEPEPMEETTEPPHKDYPPTRSLTNE